MTEEQTLHKILSKTVKTDSCWFYTGTNTSGYGTMVIDGRQQTVHRYMYASVHGEIPKGLELDHLCRVKHCINPDHLQAVTHLENVRRGPQAKDGTLDKPAPAKKTVYCLYIKDPRFAEQKGKSALVAQLLDDYYNRSVYDNADSVEDTDTRLPLQPDPTNPKRAWDPNIEEWVKV